MADETAVKEALQAAYSSAQKDLTDLEGAAVATCQELEGEGGSSGSSVASRLRSLGGRVAERLRSTFRLGVQRTLAVASTHYDMNLEQVATGYRPPSPSRASPPPCPSCSRATFFLTPKIAQPRVHVTKKETCRKSGPWSPCK